MEWHGIQIPQAISTMLTEIGLRFNFVTDTGKNSTSRGLDFAENPEHEEGFLRYAVEYYTASNMCKISHNTHYHS
jgi:hypothetical protein